MCGRYAATANPDELVEAYDVDLDATQETSRSVLKNPQRPPAGQPDYNVAPSKQAPVIVTRHRNAGSGAGPSGPGADADPVRQLRLLTWGLVPSWAKDPGIGMKLTNARSESMLDKPAFARAARRRRCLIPVSGWYEWQQSPVARDTKGKPRKQPFYITGSDNVPLALAGLYEFWKDQEAPAVDPLSWVVSYTIITTAAGPGLDRIHSRQPVVLDPERWDAWLAPEPASKQEVGKLLQAQTESPGQFQTWPVSMAVNSSGNNDPALLDPVPVEQLEGVVDPSTGEVIGA